jgi:hypothetical protein
MNVDTLTIGVVSFVVIAATYALGVVYTMLFELPLSKVIKEFFLKKSSQ